MEPIVIVGAGQAGAQAAQSLRAAGFDGDLVMFGEEPHAPYQRPPLSKKFLAGEIGPDHLLLRPHAFYAQNRVDLRTGETVTAIDLADRSVVTARGRTPFSRLLLATGTRARPLPIPGHELDGVASLRAIRDVDAIRAVLAPGARIVIVGGGYIGLEVAAVARGLGLDVTVLEAADRVLQRVVAADVSRFYQDLHAARGVRIVTGARIAGFVGAGGRATGVAMADGSVVAADLVLVAIGAVPVAELAEAAGLATGDGVLVDGRARASHPDVFAAGDCTRFHSPLYGRSIRLESVQNAIDQAKTAAAAMLGEAPPYDPVPWFWSDQYDVKLQIAGLSQGHVRAVTDGDPASGAFAVSYLDADGRLLAVDAINRPRDHMLARRAIGTRPA